MSESGARTVPVDIQILREAIDIPAYALPGDAGADICTTEDIVLRPGQRHLAPTGIAIALPEGFAAFVHPRSGLAIRQGLSIVNSPGTIDAGYRGEIKVPLVNTDTEHTIELTRGDRIAQLVIQPVYQAEFRRVDTLPESVRADKGFGSTGGFN